MFKRPSPTTYTQKEAQRVAWDCIAQMGPSLLYYLAYVNLKQARVTWEEGISTEKNPHQSGLWWYGFLKLIINVGGPSQLWKVPPHLRLVVFSAVRERAERVIRSKPGRCTLPWPLLRFLPPGPASISFSDRLRTVRWDETEFLPSGALGHGVYHSIRKP